MNLALTPTQRKRADELILATVKDGADATGQLLRHFPRDAWPALIAYLARVACESRVPETARVVSPAGVRYRRGQPERFTEPQRKEAHRRYLAGERTIEAVLGEREYQRVWYRRRRAAS